MKSILSASVCAAVLAFAVPALADTSTSTPTTTHHHMAKHHGMKGKMMAKGGKMSGDAAVQDLNAKSLAAARSGQPLDVGGGSSAPASMPAPAQAMPATGTPATTTPSNAPGGQ